MTVNASAARSTVLVVEDDTAIVEFVQLQLEKAGFVVDAAHDGEQGLIKAFEVIPDVIVLDLSMPRIDGFEVLRQLKAKRVFRDIPVLVMSARSGRTDVMAALDLGAEDYMVKPLDGRDLARRVRQLVRPQPDSVLL
jgi:DNA-binding response OmpR family regulator